MSENEIETRRKCNAQIGVTPNGKPIQCTEFVRYEGSFVCEKHTWNYGRAGNKRKWTIEEIKKRIEEMKTAHKPTT